MERSHGRHGGSVWRGVQQAVRRQPGVPQPRVRGGVRRDHPGVYIAQQARKPFGLSYRSLVGNDLEGQEHGYKLHLVYGCLAAPSERARATVNDSPEAMGLSWELSTTPVAVGTIAGKEYRPTAHLTIDSTKVDADALAAIEEVLYGKDATVAPDPVAPAVVARLPLPAEIYEIVTAVV